MRQLTVNLVIALSLLMMGCASTDSMVKVDSRPGIKQGFLHLMPKDPPVASVILYAGGSGILKLSDNGSINTDLKWNFLVRSRDKFVDHGFQVAVIDSPTDDKFGPSLYLCRSCRDHVTDSVAVAEFLRSQADVPVWLVGTSRGSDSVAYLAVNGGDAFDGAVFTSSVVDATYHDLEKVNIPALVLHNKDDECMVSPPSVAERLYDKLVNAPRRELVWVNGGSHKSRECDAMSPHGYYHIESKAVDAVATFIKGR